MVRLIDTYIEKDGPPCRLFVAKGVLLMDMADAALRDPSVPGIFIDLELKALVAFQNASATSTLSSFTEKSSSFTEKSSDLEPLILEGDAWYSRGQTDQAKAAYRRAVVKFIEDDEPARQILWLADATARWVTVLAKEGACQSSARIADWDSVWTRLGAAEDHDLCTIVRTEQPSAEARDKLGLIAAIFRPVSEPVHRCNRMDDARRIAQTALEANLQTIKCLRKVGDPSRRPSNRHSGGPSQARQSKRDQSRFGEVIPEDWTMTSATLTCATRSSGSATNLAFTAPCRGAV